MDPCFSPRRGGWGNAPQKNMTKNAKLHEIIPESMSPPGTGPGSFGPTSTQDVKWRVQVAEHKPNFAGGPKKHVGVEKFTEQKRSIPNENHAMKSGPLTPPPHPSPPSAPPPSPSPRPLTLKNFFRIFLHKKLHFSTQSS